MAIDGARSSEITASGSCGQLVRSGKFCSAFFAQSIILLIPENGMIYSTLYILYACGTRKEPKKFVTVLKI